MEKVLRYVIAGAAMWACVNGNAAPLAGNSGAPRMTEFPEFTGQKLAEDAAAHGVPKSDIYKVQLLASGGIEIIGKVEQGNIVGVGRFTLKRGGSGERQFFLRITMVDSVNLEGMKTGEIFHAVIYPSGTNYGRPKDRRREYFFSPSEAYVTTFTGKNTVDAIVNEDRTFWPVYVTNENQQPLTAEQRKQARESLIQKRAAQGLSTDIRIDDFALLDGRKYDTAIVTRVLGDGVDIETDSGVLHIKFSEMPETMKEKYGYDPAKAAATMQANVQRDEAREAALRAEQDLWRQQAAQRLANEQAEQSRKAAEPTPAPQYPYTFEHPDLPAIRKYVLESMFADSKETVFRWNRVPLASTFGATDEEQKIFLGIVDDINRALAKAPMRITAPKAPLTLAANVAEDEGAAIHVYFCDSKEIPAISAKEHFAYAFHDGISWNWSEPGRALKRSVIVIPRNHIDPKYFRHRVLAEMLQTIGLGGSPRNLGLRSIYSMWDMDTLQPNDVHLIAFLYGHVSPGMGYDQVKQAINQFWDEDKK